MAENPKCAKCNELVDINQKHGATESGKLYHIKCIPPEAPPAPAPAEKKNPAEAENPPNLITITSRGVTVTGNDNSDVGTQQDKVIDQTIDVVGDNKVPRLPYTDRPSRGMLRTRIGFKGVTKGGVEMLKEKLKWYGASPNPPSEYEVDTDNWFDAAVEAETGHEGDNDISQLIRISHMNASEMNLRTVIVVLKRIKKPWAEMAIAQAEKIMAGEYKGFRYKYGGRLLPGGSVVGGGKVSATSEFFSSLVQALTYNTNPPKKENPVEIVLDATNPDREAIQKAYPEASMTDAVEFVLYAENDADIYRQRLQPWTVNFGRKMAAGKFDRKLAVGALADYLAKEVQTKYFKETGGGYGPAPEMTKATKMAFGELMLDSLMEGIQEVADDIKAGRRNKLGHKKGENPPSEAVMPDGITPRCQYVFSLVPYSNERGQCALPAFHKESHQAPRSEQWAGAYPGSVGYTGGLVNPPTSENPGEYYYAEVIDVLNDDKTVQKPRGSTDKQAVISKAKELAKKWKLPHYLAQVVCERDGKEDSIVWDARDTKTNPPEESENPGPYVPPDAPIRQSMSIGECVVTDADDVFAGIEPGWNGRVMAVGNGFYRVLWSSGPMSGRVTAIPPKYVIPPHMRANPATDEIPTKENGTSARIRIQYSIGGATDHIDLWRNSDGYPQAVMPDLKKLISWLKAGRIRQNDVAEAASWLILIGAQAQHKDLMEFGKWQSNFTPGPATSGMGWRASLYSVIMPNVEPGDANHEYIVDLTNMTATEGWFDEGAENPPGEPEATPPLPQSPGETPGQNPPSPYDTGARPEQLKGNPELITRALANFRTYHCGGGDRVSFTLVENEHGQSTITVWTDEIRQNGDFIEFYSRGERIAQAVFKAASDIGWKKNPPPGVEHVEAPNPTPTKPISERPITEADKKKYAEAIKHFEQFNMSEPGVIQKIQFDLPDKDTPAVVLGSKAIDITYQSDKEGAITNYHHSFADGRKAYFVRRKGDSGLGTVLIPDVNILDWLYN